MPSSSRPSPPGNLPAEVTSFVGRRTERREIRRLLSVSRLVTVTGLGGVGKTRIATSVARDVKRAFGDGVWFVDLSTVTDRALVANTVATALGLNTQHTDPMPNPLLEHLASRSALVILDNCEHLLETSAELVNDLLQACPRLHLVVTSREPLGVMGEATFSLAPLPVAADRLPATATLTQYDGISLFLDRARTACPGFEITDDNQAAIVEVCQRLDGIPLALELAAVRLRGLTPTELAGQLSEHARLLSDGNRSGPDRQRTLRDCIDWSYHQCTADEQALWARASVFAGEMDLDSVVAVCGAPDQGDKGRLIEVLLSLVNKSIITTRTVGRRTRYRMLEVIKDYGRERLSECGLLPELRVRHSDYFFDLAECSQAESASSHQAEWTVRLRAEHANLQAAFQFCGVQRDLADRALQTVILLREHWITIGAINEARHWLEVLYADGTISRPTAGAALRSAAYLAILQGEVETASKLIVRAGDVETDPDEITLARVDQTWCMVALARGDWDEAVALGTSALAVFDRAGPVQAQLGCMLRIQMAQRMARRLDESLAWHRRIVRVAERLGDSWYRSYSLWCAGLSYWQAGDREAALRAIREGLRLKQELTDIAGVATCLESLAWLLTSQDPQCAAVLLGAAAGHWELAHASQMRLGTLGLAHDNAVREALEALGQRKFESLLAQGRALTQDEAIALGMQTKAVPADSAEAVPSPLTRREREVADLVAKGLNNKDIANVLVVSPRTAETHVEHILAKLGFRSRAQIAAWVLDRGRQNHRPTSELSP